MQRTVSIARQDVAVSPSNTGLVQYKAFEHLLNPPQFKLKHLPEPTDTVYLIRLEEIHEDKPRAYRRALAKVFTALPQGQGIRLIYLLEGGPEGVKLYFGVITTRSDNDGPEALKNLRAALDGQLPGIDFGAEVDRTQRQTIAERWQNFPYHEVLLGVPTDAAEDSEEATDAYGVDRLVRAVLSGSSHGHLPRWQMIIVAEPLAETRVRGLLDAAYDLASQLAAHVSTSLQLSENTSTQRSASSNINTSHSTNTSETKGTNKGESATDSKSGGESSSRSSNSSSSSSTHGKNSGWSHSKTFSTGESSSRTTGWSDTQGIGESASLSRGAGHSVGFSRELTDKRAQHLMDEVDQRLIERLRSGLSTSLFTCAIYLGADNRSIFERLKTNVRATFRGSQTSPQPLTHYPLADAGQGLPTILPRAELPNPADLLFHSFYLSHDQRLGSLLTADELAIIAGLPQHEIQGVRRRKSVGFAVDLPKLADQDALLLGEIIDRGRRQAANPVKLARLDLNKHLFITGVTGAGKTTTCLRLLNESRLPFLVIEPAKTEYRALAREFGEAIDYYRPGTDKLHSLRLNPFALIHPRQQISSVASFVKSAIAAVMPLEASMPMMIEEAIREAYRDKGWDIEESRCLYGDDPFAAGADAWPTFTEVILKLDAIIPRYKLGREFEEKYRGSLVSRLRSLTDGNLGPILNVRQSLDFCALLERRAVIELEELNGEEKALFMALLLGAINEAVRAMHARDPGFRQLTLIEEAHRLLARPEPGDTAKAWAVEAFADTLAEVRKYGLGLIIADQIPAKLIPDVIKNTHIKIVHRLFAEDDRRAMGEAMMMNDEQRAFLPNLAVGEAVVYCGGWHAPAHVQIQRYETTAHEPDLEAYFARQFFRERARYYPNLHALGLFTDDDRAEFCEFVRSARLNLNSLLRVLDSTQNAQPTGARCDVDPLLASLKAWLARWQAVFAAPQRGAGEGQDAGEINAPLLMARAWFALLMDSTPRPKLEVNHPLNLRPSSLEERQFNEENVCALIETIMQADTAAAILATLSTPAKRSIKNFVDKLTQVKSF